MKRRKFVENAALSAAGLTLVGLSACNQKPKVAEEPAAPTIELADASSLFFKLSLAQWSIHSQIRKGEIDFLDFASKGSKFKVEALEYVTQLFPDEKFTDDLLKEINKRAEDNGLKNHLIMIDHCGDLAISDAGLRNEAINMHKAWIDAAASLGCQSVRVNMEGDGTDEDIINLGSESLATLCEYSSQYNINVLIENHGGFSSNTDELIKLFDKVNMDNCGGLPDFGNFCIEKDEDDNCINEYDAYQGIELMMPYAKGGVSAKAKIFDEAGNESNIDYARMLNIVKAAGFSGYIGIEYENDEPSMEDPGILKTRELLIREGSKLS